MKILFVSHNASRTGAPILLLDICKWIKHNTDISFDILLLRDGEMLNDFQLINKTYILDKTESHKIRWIFKKITKNKYREKAIWKKLKSNNYDMVYINTIAGVRFLNMSTGINFPNIIVHAHELEVGIKHMCNEDAFIQNISRTDLIIAASKAVEQTLKEIYSVPDGKIVTIYEPINVLKIKNQKTNDAENLRKELNIPENAFIIGGSGTRDWRKGIDIFIRTASKISNENIYFIWLGGKNDGVDYLQLKYDISRMNICKKVFLLESVNEPVKYFKDFNVFFLSSREDPFPLVCLENALLGNPIICFENGGGMPEFVRQGAGMVAPYMDTDFVANAIIKYYNDRELCESHGNFAREIANNYDIEKFMNQLNLLLLERLNIPLLNVKN